MGLMNWIATFGDIFDLHPRRSHARFALADRLSDDGAAAVCADAVMGRFAAGAADLCHELLAGTCTDVFAHVQSAGLQSKITIFGECFSFRPQRTGTKLSTHAWGIALDLNPESNAQGAAGNMDAGVVAIFKQAGFSWGGDWPGSVRDPMHFQLCTGY